MDPILKSLKKIVKNEFAFGLNEKDNPNDINEWVDTGCYALNAALSDGDIFKGIPRGKRITLAGPSSTAKSYFIMYMIKAFTQNVKNPYVVVFESEGASITKMAFDFGVPEEKVIIFPVSTIETFRTQITNLLDEIIEIRSKDKNLETQPNFLIALDSLGMLGTDKEYKDALSGNDKVDMTRAKIIRSVFRLITLKLSLTQTTMLVANHTGAAIGSMSPLPVQGGGDGIKYSSDVVLMLSKAKEKDGTAHVGANISLRVDKSRYQPEGNVMKILLLFRKGLFKYSSLLDIGITLNVITKEGFSYVFPDGRKAKRKDIIKNAEEYFSGDNLQKLRDVIYSTYSFGGDGIETSFDDVDLDESEGDENE